ncbi:MAG: antiterminator LoaP [Caldicoprobacterales bacterium]
MKWYALFVKTGDEENVRVHIEKHLPDREIRILIPKRKLQERRQGKVYERIRLLLPGYVLIRADMGVDLYYELKRVPGLIKILGDEKEPVEVLEDEMAILLALTDSSDLIGFSQLYKQGDNIRVHDGPLKGLEGIIESYNHRKKRVRIRLDVMGQTRFVDLGAHLISK